MYEFGENFVSSLVRFIDIYCAVRLVKYQPRFVIARCASVVRN